MARFFTRFLAYGRQRGSKFRLIQSRVATGFTEKNRLQRILPIENRLDRITFHDFSLYRGERMKSYEIPGKIPVHNPQFTTFGGLLEFEKTLFVLVNVMDVVMTFLLLSTGTCYESNPLADYFLQGWGMLGMTLFKLVIVGVVLLLANLVALWRVESSRNLLHFGSFLVGAVVAYSMYLKLMFA